MKALRSKKYLAGSKGATCKFRISGVCRGGTETVVPCHLRDRHTGGAMKASDISVADGCFWCHDVMDRRAPMPDGKLIDNETWLMFALAALQETIEARVELNLLGFPHDPPPKAKPPKKPRADRPATNWPKGRKIQSRPMRQQ